MRTFGRVLAAMGAVLAGVGGVGAIAMLPPSVLEDAGSYVEARRQALREHLPDVPEMGELITGTSTADCAGTGEAASAEGAQATVEPGSDEAAAGCEEQGKAVGVIRGGNGPARPGKGGAFFSAPASAKGSAAN